MAATGTTSIAMSECRSPSYLSDSLNAGHNNFNLLRLLACLCVIYIHSFYLTPAPSSQDIFASMLTLDNVPTFPLQIFFFLSGLLLSQSLLKDRRILPFLTRRAFRLFPGLIVCNIITVVIVGLLVTDLPRREYLTNPETWQYIWRNCTLYDFQWRLPGVLTQAKYGLNGSIWTLPKEVDCYIIIAAIWTTAGLFGNRLGLDKVITLLFFSTLLLVALYFPTSLPQFDAQSAAYYLACFCFGVICTVMGDRIALRFDAAIAMWCIVLLFYTTPAKQIVFTVSLLYSAALIFSRDFVIRRLALPFDASYGTYIYGFLTQQVMFHKLPWLGFHLQQVGSMSIAVLIGIVSWFSIEKPAMDFGKRLFDRQRRSETLVPIPSGVADGFLEAARYEGADSLPPLDIEPRAA